MRFNMEIQDIPGMLDKARSIPGCEYEGSWGGRKRMQEKQVEIHAIELRIGCPLCDLTFDYRPADGAIIVNISGAELFVLPYPPKEHPTRKLHEAIGELHEWMVSRHKEDVEAGEALERYTGLLLSWVDERKDKGFIHVPTQSRSN